LQTDVAAKEPRFGSQIGVLAWCDGQSSAVRPAMSFDALFQLSCGTQQQSLRRAPDRRSCETMAENRYSNRRVSEIVLARQL